MSQNCFNDSIKAQLGLGVLSTKAIADLHGVSVEVVYAAWEELCREEA